MNYMKAKDNYTGEIIEIDEYSPVTYRTSDGTCGKRLIKGLTFLDAEKDYYTKLEHQYAGMAMQGMVRTVGHDRMYPPEKIAIYAVACATALVKKLKSESYERTRTD